jgi:hypothetical protein
MAADFVGKGAFGKVGFAMEADVVSKEEPRGPSAGWTTSRRLTSSAGKSPI